MSDSVSARRSMVETQIRPAGVNEARLVAAFDSVPREIFVPSNRVGIAYTDSHHPLPQPGRVMSSPAVLARLLNLAAIESHEHVLDLAAGTGYAAALIAQLAAHVTAVESDAALAASAKSALQSLGLDNVSVLQQADMQVSGKLFDVIFIEDVIDAPTEQQLSLLAPAGRIVALIRNGAAAKATVFTRKGSDLNAEADFSLPALSRRMNIEESDFLF